MERLTENMTKDLITIRWNRSMGEAAELMEKNRIRHLPVVDESGVVVGILSDRDVARSMDPARPECLEEKSVSDGMTWPALTVDEELPIYQVAEGMVDEKVSAFLVTRGKQIVGIVTSEDLIKLLAKLTKPDSRAKNYLYSPLVKEALQELQAAGI
jgi:acetoin utilization protein AcuB